MIRAGHVQIFMLEKLEIERAFAAILKW